MSKKSTSLNLRMEPDVRQELQRLAKVHQRTESTMTYWAVKLGLRELASHNSYEVKLDIEWLCRSCQDKANPLDRWAKYTGKDPIREDGKSWRDLRSQSIPSK